MKTLITKINPRLSQQTWQKQSDNKHSFQLERYTGYLLEAEDLQFHHNSAVFLPEYLSLESPVAENNEHINGIAVLRAALLHAQGSSNRKLIIVGHTDQSGEKFYNLKLSRLRAKSVYAALVGDYKIWVNTAITKSRVSDYQVLLQWIARTWGWSCDPVKIDDDHGTQTSQALKNFQAAYNNFFDKKISIDGIIGKQSWKAMFDVFMKELIASLETDKKGLEHYQQEIQFVDDSAKAVGVGELFPKDRIIIDNYRSEQDRRVEMLWFEPKDNPQPGEYPTPDQFNPKKTHIYNSRLYIYKRIDVNPVPSLVWLDLQTVNEQGYRVKNVKLKLEPSLGPIQQIVTDETGYWSNRIVTGNKIRVTMANGRPVRFGTTMADQMPSGRIEDTAIIVPRVASRTITDLVVPSINEHIIENYRKQINRYGRHPKNNNTNARTGGNGEPVGEKKRETSSRGAKTPKGKSIERFTRRTYGNYVADNLFIAAGFDEQLLIKKLQTLLSEWLKDHYPAAIRREYFLEIVLNNQVSLFSDKQQKLGEFKFAENHSLSGRFGAYTAQEFYGVDGNILFADMNSQSTGISTNVPEISTEKTNENDPPESEKPTKAIKNEPPQRNEKSKDYTMVDLLNSSDQQTYRDLTNPLWAQRKIEIIYVFPGLGPHLLLARHGGTGLMESYPPDKSMHKSIHTRNKLVSENMGMAYNLYIRWYIEQVEKISSDPKKVSKDKPHPEIQLHRLGPPDSEFQFPKPTGASNDQYLQIIEGYRDGLSYPNELSAWKAITKKLNEIRGKRDEGSIWIDVEFSVEAGNYAGPLSGASLKLNFEADNEGRIKVTGKKEIPLTIGTMPKALGGSLPVKITYIKNQDTGRVDSKVSFSVGKYGLEIASNGNVKYSLGPSYSEWNQASAIGGTGFEISLRDIIAKTYNSKPPEWVEDLPNLKAKAGLGFRLITEGTLLKLITRSPGFFEMRPRPDFTNLDWASLDWDERSALITLGFDDPTDLTKKFNTLWDDRKRPASTNKQFSRLSPEEKIASVLLPIPTSDPEWLKFWNNWGQQKI